MSVIGVAGGFGDLKYGPLCFRENEFTFGILVAASGCPAIGFFLWEYPTVTRDPKAGSIQLIPIANKLNIPW